MSRFPWGKKLNTIEVPIFDRGHVNVFEVTEFDPYKTVSRRETTGLVSYHSEELGEYSMNLNYITLALMVWAKSGDRRPDLARGLNTMMEHL